MKEVAQRKTRATPIDKQMINELKSLFDGANEQVYVSDPETYEVLFVNKKTKSLYGSRSYRRKCYEAFQNLQHPCPFCTNKQILGKNFGRTYVWEMQNQRTKRWYRCIDKAISWPGRKCARFEIAFDITEQKKLEKQWKESKEFFRSVVDNSHDAILILNDDFRIIFANEQAVHLGGYPKKEVLGKDFRNFLSPEAKSLTVERYMRRQKGEKVPSTYELKIIRKDGYEIKVEIKSAAIRREDGSVCSIVQLVDVTEGRRIEEEKRIFESRLSALNGYGQALNMAETLQEIYSLTLDAAQKTLEFEYASIMALEGNELTVKANRGYRKRLSMRLRMDQRRGITVKAAKTGNPIWVPDVRKNKNYVAGGTSILSEYAVPIKVGKKVLAVLNVEREQIAALDRNDKKLLELLASHAATAMSNLQKRAEIERRSTQFASLMKSSAEMIRSTDLHKRLKTIAEAVTELGWRRAVISLRDEKLNTIDVVSAGLTAKEEQYLREHQDPGSVWQERLGSFFERFRLGEAYYLPWSDPLVRKQFKNALSSKISQAQMIDWDPDDLLFIPLRTPDGQVVGIMSIDDPEDGRRPTTESLAPLELFAHQAAVAIESAQLFNQRESARKQVKEYAEHLEEMVKERTTDLRESEEKLRSIFAASPDAITVTDLDGKIIECNESALKMLGYTSKTELMGKNPFELVVAEDDSRVMNLGKTLEKGSLSNVEFTFVTKDGRQFPAEMSASVLRDASRKPVGFVAIFNDITERKRMQQQLIRSERLSTIGEVAGMVGHDLRNPLTGIAGAAYYMKKKLGSKLDRKNKEMLELIEDDIHYSNKIINDLLDYSRDIELELVERTPKAMVKDSLKAMTVPKNVYIRDLTKTVPKIMVDDSKMKRTFVNIVKNALDAMPNGGTLTITSLQSDDSVKFSFSDTGMGIGKETMSKLWTPLFTTKAKGMGFGLAISKRIVERHGGSIAVESTFGKGTTFTITIPLKPKNEKGGEIIWVKPLESSLLTTTKT
jgi:PAS domain S-box-containing protein